MVVEEEEEEELLRKNWQLPLLFLISHSPKRVSGNVAVIEVNETSLSSAPASLLRPYQLPVDSPTIALVFSSTNYILALKFWQG